MRTKRCAELDVAVDFGVVQVDRDARFRDVVSNQAVHAVKSEAAVEIEVAGDLGFDEIQAAEDEHLRR